MKKVKEVKEVEEVEKEKKRLKKKRKIIKEKEVVINYVFLYYNYYINNLINELL